MDRGCFSVVKLGSLQNVKRGGALQKLDSPWNAKEGPVFPLRTLNIEP